MQALAVRAIAICAVLLACGRPEAPATPRAPAHDELRLPEGVAPIAYDLTLELDPARDTVIGRVAISISVSAPATTQLWLHAADLEITRARLRGAAGDEEVGLIPGGARSGRDDRDAREVRDVEMRGFALPRPVGPGALTLVIDYTARAKDLTGRAFKDEEGLFRQAVHGRWYLFSQSEAIFARRIVPCFDEPRFKPAWRVTAIVPRDQVALANAPVAVERALPDGRREVRFAEISPMPSYLLAVAVGPFDVVDAGRLGRARLPVRLAVARGDGARVGRALRELPRIIDALEAYVDAPLPGAKLDLVAVPHFFGAMENPGLITFDRGILVGGRDLIAVAAHELAHQWFGNSVTPAWWEHLWLSEAFATWLAARTATALGVTLPSVLAHGARLAALQADEQVDAEPLVRPIASSVDIEAAFDAIAYEKGAEVLETFERFVGPTAFQAAVRRYLAAHAGTSVTSQAFVDALAAATSPAVGAALASNLVHAGMPVVELELRCGSTAVIVASARGGASVPVCVRYPLAAETARACLLAAPRSELPLPAAAGCPSWVVGNDSGRGYYQTVWRGRAPHPPVALLSSEERLARGDDAAAGARNGDLAIAAALGELATLAAAGDPDGEMAALSIAQAIDPLVTETVRPAWAAWLAARFTGRVSPAILAPTRSLNDYLVNARFVRLAGAAVPPATLAAARGAVERAVDSYHDDIRLRLAAVRDTGPLFERIVQAAAAARLEPQRRRLLSTLGEFPPALAPRLVDVMLDRRFSAVQVWPALATMLRRADTAGAAWRALHVRFDDVLGGLTGPRASGVIAAAGSQCDARARTEVAADFAPRVAAIEGGRRALDRALASIDRCIARRAAAGDIARALAAVPAVPAPAAPAAGRALTTPP